MPDPTEDRTSLPISPSLTADSPELAFPRLEPPIGARTVRIVGIAMLVGIAAGFAAWAPLGLIGLITNLVFYHRISAEMAAPGGADLGPWVLVVPMLGALVVGVMAGRLIGVVTRRDLLGHDGPRRPLREVLRRGPAVIFGDHTVREAADHMIRESVGRLVVVRREDTGRIVGIVTRSDLLKAHARRLHAMDRVERGFTRSSELRPRHS